MNRNQEVSEPMTPSSIETVSWICAVIGGICTLGYYFAPYIYATLMLWFGGAQ
jgi:hypothetical protein